METKTFKVPAISCQHCVHTIKMEVSDVPGVESVAADKDTQMVTVQWHEPRRGTRFARRWPRSTTRPKG